MMLFIIAVIIICFVLMNDKPHHPKAIATEPISPYVYNMARQADNYRKLYQDNQARLSKQSRREAYEIKRTATLYSRAWKLNHKEQ